MDTNYSINHEYIIAETINLSIFAGHSTGRKSPRRSNDS